MNGQAPAPPERPCGADGPLRSVSIAMDVLECFTSVSENGASEIARQLGIAKSTASRMLATLASGGLLERRTNGRYRLGLRLFEYGQLAADRLLLKEMALPILADLRDRVSETVQLRIPLGAEVLYVDRLEGTHGLRFHTETYRRVPGHSSSSGKAIAAFNPFVAQAVFNAGLERRTPYTIVDPARYVPRDARRGQGTRLVLLGGGVRGRAVLGGRAGAGASAARRCSPSRRSPSPGPPSASSPGAGTPWSPTCSRRAGNCPPRSPASARNPDVHVFASCARVPAFRARVRVLRPCVSVLCAHVRVLRPRSGASRGRRPRLRTPLAQRRRSVFVTSSDSATSSTTRSATPSPTICPYQSVNAVPGVA